MRFDCRSSLLAAMGLALVGCSSEPTARRDGDITKVPSPAPIAPTTKGSLVVEERDGYDVRPLARGLDLPAGICFDDAGDLCVLEAGGFLGNNPGRTPPRIKVFSPEGEARRTIDLTGTRVVWPATGICWADGGFYITHRDENHFGCISRVEKDGKVTPIVTGLPSRGDHGTNQICVGPDGKLYFSQGTATNSGIVGLDDFVAFGWPQLHPDVHDIPAKTIVLTGKNFETADPRGAMPSRKTITGAFMPFGKSAERGTGVRGEVKCNGAVLRCDKDGKKLEVYCWGLRNPFGLGFAPAGRLYTTCQGMDLRGSRPIADDKDALLSLTKDTWYGWPDYTTDLRPLLDNEDHDPPSELGKRAEPLIDLKMSGAEMGAPSPDDVAARFDVRSSSCGFAWAPPGFGKIGGRLVVAQFGTLGPAADPTAATWPGCRVVTVDDEGEVEDFLKNDDSGPASHALAIGRGFERPIDVKFGPDGALYVVDYGVVSVKVDEGAGMSILAREGTGFIWKVTTGGGEKRRDVEKTRTSRKR
ncbi:MAG: sorbosone dehydrogenase family protein [Planctomycetota bacterium]